mmetsp:Transcript_116672/g.371177  ORF Transcript_116672/g.371177 Transcript_116672/m.371177 type:complete len:287 (-) Transcript_116672:131-991(-)
MTQGHAAGVEDNLPPASSFRKLQNSSWSAHPSAPDWLLKDDDQIYCHTPSGSLWRRRHSRLIREDEYRRAVGLALGGPRLMLRAVFAGWSAAARRWRSHEEDTVESPVPRPSLRTGCHGLRRSRQGVSPPPSVEGGWHDAGHGWQAHPDSPKWLRKFTEEEGPAFFYLPSESLWMEMPNGSFVCVDAYHTALTVFLMTSDSTVRRSCLLAWANQVNVVKMWRQRIKVMSSGDTSGDQEPATQDASSGNDAQPGESVMSNFPVRTAFLTRGLPRRGSQGGGVVEVVR